MTRKPRIVTLGLAGVFTATGLIAVAGDLNPPPGAVVPTHKTLTEVEPRTAVNLANAPGDADSLFKITLPGSYYLTGNLTGVAGKHGIEITASGVTLDFNGFDLAGVPAMGAFDGVRATVAGLTNIAVVNGSVRNWGQNGINLGDSNVSGCAIQNVRASGNARTGIFAGIAATISRCSAIGGLYGIYTQEISTLSGCVAQDTSVIGLRADSSSTLTNCSATSNTGDGIQAVSTCTISNCTSASNTGNGILTGDGCTVSNCVSVNNLQSGISVISGSTVADCAARLNKLDGIFVTTGCTVRGNTCSLNGNGGNGAGIHVLGFNNRIEGNNCSGADRGIDVDQPGNIISRNSCSNNTTSWDVVAGNVILVVNGIGAPAILGSAGGAAPGSADPSANFSF